MTKPGMLSAAAAALMLAATSTLHAQAQAPDAMSADRPMASRPELQALADNGDGQPSARARLRLTNGDFRPGDRIWLVVQGDTALTDTFTVWPDQSLHLPSPTVGSLSLT